MKNKLLNCEDFKSEMFLFASGELPEKRIAVFRSHLQTCDSCKHTFDEIKLVTSAYNSLSAEDVDDYKFDEMIQKAISLEIRQKEYLPKRKSLIEIFGFYRLSFGGAVIVAAIILFIISSINEPNFEKNLPVNLLDWNGKEISDKIERIGDQIISMKSDEWDIYIVRKNKKENWNTTLKNIRNQINEMKKSTSKKEL